MSSPAYDHGLKATPLSQQGWNFLMIVYSLANQVECSSILPLSADADQSWGGGMFN